MHSTEVGKNRHGETLADVIKKGTGVSKDALYALDTLWVEQSKEGEGSGLPSSRTPVDSLGRRDSV